MNFDIEVSERNQNLAPNMGRNHPEVQCIAVAVLTMDVAMLSVATGVVWLVYTK